MAGRHRIRLRAPWAAREEPQGTVLRRRFHRPTGLDAGTRVFLVLEAVSATLRLELNGAPLGESEGETGAEFELTGRLASFNELAVIVLGEAPHEPAKDLPFQAALEVRSP